MLKRIKFILILFALIIIFSTIIFVNNFSTIFVEVATGAMVDNNENIYGVTTGIGGENKILCSPEQYVLYTGDIDWGKTDTLFVVIYERKVFIPFHQKVISIKKYKDEWNYELHSRIIPNKTYYRLAHEDFQSVTNKKSIVTRVYEKYESGNSQMRLIADNFVTPYFDNINSAKEWIRKKNKGLQLRPLTIVSDSVLSKWEKEAYVPTIEYSTESPEGLTYEDLIKK